MNERAECFEDVGAVVEAGRRGMGNNLGAWEHVSGKSRCVGADCGSLG